MSNVTSKAASGVETSTTFNYGATGSLTSKVIATVSADERIIRVQRDSDGDGDIDLAEVTLKTADGNGSYTWTQEDAFGNTVVESNHIIDENGVDTINLWIGNTRYTSYIDVGRQATELATVERIYDTVFDRAMSAAEKHAWTRHYSASGLDTTGLINELLSSTEFQIRFSALNDASFVTQIYQNANGRGAMLSEYAEQLKDLRLGTETRADMIAALSESAEHYAVGNGHELTSNTLSGGPAMTQDHIVDRADAAELVDDVFQTVLDRAASAGDVIAWTDVITNGSYTVDQFAGQLIASGEFVTAFGSLNNAAFVDRLYTNAVGQIAPNGEYQAWVAALNSGEATRADLAIAIAQSPDLWM
jgi:trimeric autotransporter adhesin